jgi:hypothetical protein
VDQLPTSLILLILPRAIFDDTPREPHLVTLYIFQRPYIISQAIQSTWLPEWLHQSPFPPRVGCSIPSRGSLLESSPQILQMVVRQAVTAHPRGSQHRTHVQSASVEKYDAMASSRVVNACRVGLPNGVSMISTGKGSSHRGRLLKPCLNPLRNADQF